jgi:TRAP-type C4-dicarboxylate transport system substrate-binding protein
MEAAAKASEFAREKQVKVDQKALERIKEEGATLVPMDREKMAEIVMEPVMKVGEEQGLAELYQKIREYKE